MVNPNNKLNQDDQSPRPPPPPIVPNSSILQLPHLEPPSSTSVPDDQSPGSRTSSPSGRPVPSVAGSGQLISGRNPAYRGIRIRSGKWVSEIREPRKSNRIWLGTYPTPEMAAAAYDVAALTLKGPDTPLNFPESIYSYPTPTSTSATDIQAAAATAAATRAPPKPKNEPKQDVGWPETAASSDPRDAPLEEPSHEEFIDVEELLNMPNLLVDMAGGMLVSPPRIISSPSSDDSPRHSDAESLWSYN